MKDAAGREITGLTPTWLMNGGEGLIGPHGVASIDVAQQAGGMDFWRSEAAAR